MYMFLILRRNDQSGSREQPGNNRTVRHQGKSALLETSLYAPVHRKLDLLGAYTNAPLMILKRLL